MNWKKFLLIGLAVGAFAFAAAPRAEAGISVSFGFGPGELRIRYGYGYPAYYPYGTRLRIGIRGTIMARRRVVYVGPRRYYRHHGRRAHHRHYRPPPQLALRLHDSIELSWLEDQPAQFLPRSGRRLAEDGFPKGLKQIAR